MIRLKESIARELLARSGRTADAAKAPIAATRPRRRWAASPLRALSCRRLPDGGVELVFSGRLPGKERARANRFNPRPYTPTQTRRAHAFLEGMALEAMGTTAPLSGPIAAVIEIRIAVPASWSRAKREAALAGEILPTAKPDVDNHLKTLFDGLNRRVYHDDAQITDQTVRKRYAETDGIRACFSPIRTRRDGETG